MTNIEIIEGIDGVEMAIIDHGNEQFTSMTKAFYEEQQSQAALSTPIVNAD